MAPKKKTSKKKTFKRMYQLRKGGGEKPEPSASESSCSQDDYDMFMKDCPGYDYLPSILPAADRLIAIGDLHGDYELTLESLQLAGVIEPVEGKKDKWNWCGGSTVVVQVGDQVDRCRPMNKKCHEEGATVPDEGSDIKIMEFFTDLHRQALAVGGAVYSLLGNHELMNVTGNLNYVSLEGIKQFDDYVDPETKKTFSSGYEARKYAFSPGHEYAKFMACSRTSALIVGSTIFVHAGLLPEYLDSVNLKDRTGLEKFNRTVRRWLLGKINGKYVDKIVTSEKFSPFWTRILGNIPPNVSNNNPECHRYLKPVLKLMKVGNMVIGHTPQFYANKSGMNETCSDTLWRVDHGVSKAFDRFDRLPRSPTSPTSEQRKVQVLEITKDSEFRVLKRGRDDDDDNDDE